MKHLHYFAMALSLVGFCACVDPEPTPDAISASPASLVFEAEGGEAKVAVAVEGETEDYTFSTAPEWLTIAQDGRELTITAAPNLVKEAREYTLVLTKGTASCEVSIQQKIGTPYQGYAVADSIAVEYSGEMMYMFVKPVSEEYGGMEFITLRTEENQFVFEIYTTNFASEEEVQVEEAEYVPGKDDYNTLTLYAEKNTFVPGASFEDEGDSYCMGSYVTSLVSKADSPIKDGTIKVFKGEEGYVILAEVTDDEGNEYKVVYEGEIQIDASAAKYPSQGHADPTVNVYAATLSQNEPNSLVHTLTLLSGDEESPIMTNFEINLPDTFNPDNFSGQFYSGDENTGDPGTANLGSLVDFGGFQLPMGSYIMFDFGDYFIADGYISLTLEKLANGNYLITGSMANEDFSEMYIFINIDLDIEYYAASSDEED